MCRHAKLGGPIFLLVALAAGADWPHWRGPRRDGTASESSGWRGGAWPSKGPIWAARVGTGASSPLVADGKVYALGSAGGSDTLRCLDAATGKTIWAASSKAPPYGRHSTGDKGMYSGVTSTPEYDPETGYIYTLSLDGDLQCRDTRKKGRRVWNVNLYDAYQAPRRPKVGRSGRRDYGYTSSPLVAGDKLIVEVGSPRGNLVAFDKRAGEEAWLSQANDPAGHTGGPVPMTVGGVPCVAAHTFNGLLVARIDGGDAGRTVATYPWKTGFANNIATPAVRGGSVVLTSAYNQYRVARLDVTLNGVKKVWEFEGASKVCSPVIFKGCVYWAWRRLHCVDFATGKLKWSGGRFGEAGSVVATGDDRLIVFGGRGELALVESAVRSPKEYTELARRRRLFRDEAWPHVAVAGGRVICRGRAGKMLSFKLPD